MNALDYFLKANLYGLLFAGCYWLLLRRHTFFGLNRAYLLLSALLALVLPLVSVPTETVDNLPVGVIVLPTTLPVATTPHVNSPDWEIIGWPAYGLVAATLLIRLTLRTGRLLRFIRQSPRQRTDNYVLVLPTDVAVPTFSFFNYLILNPADRHTRTIIDHERVHIRQHHSADVLTMAVLRGLFWGCPALWLIDKLLRQVHEFLADHSVSQPTPDYARFLVSYAFGAGPDTLVNGFFNPSLLKQRIQMLHRRATTRWALGKYVLVLPLAFGLLAMTTAREEITTLIELAPDQYTTLSGTITSAADGKPLPGVSIVVKNRTRGTSTDANGKYKLSGVGKHESLVFSFVGFQTQEVNVDGRKVINVALAAAKAPANKPDKRTGQAVPGKKTPRPIQFTANDEPDNQLAWHPATKPRLHTNATDSVPQTPSSIKVQVRGNMFTAPGAEPLFIVDGVEQPIKTSDENLKINDQQTLNPNDIESITVLKDASAMATYGEKGRNGVVLITTKKK